MKYLIAIVSFLASVNLMMAKNNSLTPGDKAPELTVTTHTGEYLDLGESYKQGPVLVYFYPKADTPGCTKQACNLRDNFADLSDSGIKVIGVSSDSVKAQNAFREKHNLPFTLVADEDKKLGEAFKVGKFMGMAFKRQSFLIVDSTIVWADASATPATQAEDAMKALAAFRN